MSPTSHHHERTRRRRDAPARRSRGALRRTGQAPDHLAVPDREAFDELGGHGRIDELVGDGASADAVVGLTNRDLYDRFGFAVKGRPVPDSAVEDDRVTAGWLGAEATAERSVWLEAEAGTFGSPWTREPSESASGGAYLTTEGVESADEPPSEGHLVHEFSVPESEYHVFGRGRAPAGDSDSFWLRVDDGDWIHWDGMRTRRGWEWEPVEGEDGVRRFALDGEHTLTVAFREDDTKLDRLVVMPTRTRPVRYGEPSDTRA